METLFDDNECYTETGSELDKEIYDSVKPIVKKYVAMGYSTRDIENIVNSAVAMICVEERLNGQVKRVLEKRNAKNSL